MDGALTGKEIKQKIDLGFVAPGAAGSGLFKTGRQPHY
jgi:hypothetical protein